jgi:antibiotic biosynthesis monooxygenase (ABM) superfamily enzyme
MRIFQIKVLIQFLVSSTCFDHHVVIIRTTICMCSFLRYFFMHLCKQSSTWEDGNIEHILPPARLLI